MPSPKALARHSYHISKEESFIPVFSFLPLHFVRIFGHRYISRSEDSTSASIFSAKVDRHADGENERHGDQRDQNRMTFDEPGNSDMDGYEGNRVSYLGASLERYTNPAIAPPRFPKPTCIAIPTTRLVVPPILLLVQVVMRGTSGKMPGLMSAKA